MRLYLDTEITDYYNFQEKWDHKSQPACSQVAAVLETDGGKTVAAVSAILAQHQWTNRSGRVRIDPRITELCGIDDELVEMCGQAPQLVYNQLRLMWSAATLIVGHNISFDLGIIRRFAADLGEPQPILPESYCTMDNSAKMVGIPGARGGFKRPKLAEAYHWATGKRLQGAHDALADVYGCRQVYRGIQRAQGRGEG